MKHSNNVNKHFALPSFFSSCNQKTVKNSLFRPGMQYRKKTSVKILTVSIIALVLFFLLSLSGCDAITGIVKTNLENAEAQSENENQQENPDEQQNSESEQSVETTANESEESAAGDNGENEEAGDDESEGEIAKEIEVDPSPQTINVYYANSSGEYLIGEARDVEGSSKLVDAFYEMMKDPVDSSLFVLVPSTTKINSIKAFDDGIAKVDLSRSFLDDRFISDTVDILLIHAIANTLTEFEEIIGVELYIDGEKLDIIGQLDIKDPIYRRSDLIGQQ